MNNDYVIFNSRNSGKSYEQKIELINICNQLQQENTKLKSELQASKHVDGYFRNLEKENIQLKSDLQALRERLKCIEWVYDEDGDKCFCPACEGTSTFIGVDPESTGHYDNCWLKAEIDKAEIDKLKGDE